MNILDTIVAQKKLEVAASREKTPVKELEKSPLFGRNTLPLTNFLLDPSKTGIIAEFKRKSPSKGLFHEKIESADITEMYTRWGASGLSILTDETFFGGSSFDLTSSRFNEVPILRKDFMIDPYQFYEAKAMGADVVLLIAAILTPQQVQAFAQLAHDLSLQVLLEIHEEAELNHLCAEVDLVGVNNRDLKTFSVDVERSVQLSSKIPNNFIKISESGISNADTMRHLTNYGYKGFLIGESFMRTPNPAIAFQQFVETWKSSQT